MEYIHNEFFMHRCIFNEAVLLTHSRTHSKESASKRARESTKPEYKLLPFIKVSETEHYKSQPKKHRMESYCVAKIRMTFALLQSMHELNA